MSRDRTAEMRLGPAAVAGGPPSAVDACPRYQPAYRSELDEAETIGRFVPMVKRIATHLKGRLPETVRLDDLIQAGLIAVLRILRHSRGPQTSDAALHRSIMNAMIDEARREAWAPVRTVRLAKAAAQAMRMIKQRTGRDGSDEEIATEMGIPLSEYHRTLLEIAGIRLLHLDGLEDSDDQGLRITDDQEKVLHRSRAQAALAASIASLPERERLVVSLYYEHELNMDEVGKILGLNKSTVCRAHGRALLILRNALADWRAATDRPRAAPGG